VVPGTGTPAGERGAPANLRCDNGTELTAHALRDWCARSTVSIRYIEPGAPWQNPFAESVNARVRDELLNLESSHASSRPGSSPRTGAGTSTPSIHTRAGLPLPRRVRRRLDRPRGLTPRRRRAADRLPPLGPRAFATAVRPRRSLPSLALLPTDSHTRWTNNRGPVTRIRGTSGSAISIELLPARRSSYELRRFRPASPLTPTR
jgi:transposase InsO family protein